MEQATGIQQHGLGRINCICAALCLSSKFDSVSMVSATFYDDPMYVDLVVGNLGSTGRTDGSFAASNNLELDGCAI